MGLGIVVKLWLNLKNASEDIDQKGSRVFSPQPFVHYRSMHNVQWTGDSPEEREKEEKDYLNDMDQPLSALTKDVTCDARD